jgi:hypothetical protein
MNRRNFFALLLVPLLPKPKSKLRLFWATRKITMPIQFNNDNTEFKKIQSELINPYAGHIEHLKISINLNRTELQELGRISPYYKYVNFFGGQSND